MELTLLFGFLWYQIIAHVGISAGLHRYWPNNTAGPLFEIITLYMCILAGAEVNWLDFRGGNPDAP